MTTPKQYFDKFIQPSFEEWQNSQNQANYDIEEKKSIDLCLHLRNIEDYFGKGIVAPQFQDAFLAVRAIADATKHKKITNPIHGKYVNTSVGQYEMVHKDDWQDVGNGCFIGPPISGIGHYFYDQHGNLQREDMTQHIFNIYQLWKQSV